MRNPVDAKARDCQGPCLSGERNHECIGRRCLIGRAMSGDPIASEIVFERLAEVLLLQARRLCSAREDAEDVVQEALLHAWEHLQQLWVKPALTVGAQDRQEFISHVAAAQPLRPRPTRQSGNARERAWHRGSHGGTHHRHRVGPQSVICIGATAFEAETNLRASCYLRFIDTGDCSQTRRHALRRPNAPPASAHGTPPNQLRVYRISLSSASSTQAGVFTNDRRLRTCIETPGIRLFRTGPAECP